MKIIMTIWGNWKHISQRLSYIKVVSSPVSVLILYKQNNIKNEYYNSYFKKSCCYENILVNSNFVLFMSLQSWKSHPDDINRLDGNISCDLHRTNSLYGDTVFEGVEVLLIHFDLQHVKQSVTLHILSVCSNDKLFCAIN